MQISISPEQLKPLIEAVVAEAIQRFAEVQGTLPTQLAYSEEQAAHLLALEPNQLRDERRRGRIRAHVIVGGRVRYTREDLVAYLMRQDWSEQNMRKSGWQAGRSRESTGASED
jgi:hypothetical protein